MRKVIWNCGSYPTVFCWRIQQNNTIVPSANPLLKSIFAFVWFLNVTSQACWKLFKHHKVCWFMGSLTLNDFPLLCLDCTLEHSFAFLNSIFMDNVNLSSWLWSLNCRRNFQSQLVTLVTAVYFHMPGNNWGVVCCKPLQCQYQNSFHF